MAKCINCNDIELKNPKAKYCSDKCRMAFKRRAIHLNKEVFGEQPEQKTRTQYNPNKHSKEIKCFADLPPDVQATINRTSESNEEKVKRTKIAISYQHTFPDSFHSTGVN